jgi:hypothetical protein
MQNTTQLLSEHKGWKAHPKVEIDKWELEYMNNSC